MRYKDIINNIKHIILDEDELTTDTRIKIIHYSDDEVWVELFESEIAIQLDFKRGKVYLDSEFLDNEYSKLDIIDMRIITRVMEYLENNINMFNLEKKMK